MLMLKTIILMLMFTLMLTLMLMIMPMLKVMLMVARCARSWQRVIKKRSTLGLKYLETRKKYLAKKYCDMKETLYKRVSLFGHCPKWAMPK